MIETLTLITLCISYLIFFRPGKTPPLKNPLVIERVGHYRMTLAPQLNLAQPFIEAIAEQLRTSIDAKVNNSTHLFEVRDKRVTSHGYDYYLLSVTGRAGLLYFQAIPPLTEHQDKHSGDMRKFLHEWVSCLSESSITENSPDEHRVETVLKVAAEHGINIRVLEY